MMSHEWKQRARARATTVVTEHGGLMALLLVVAYWSVSMLHRGHSWGDDFTLYLRQSKSLVDGNVGQVIADNHFNVDNAAKPGFSPYVYPWGWPMLLAPFVRLFGLNYLRLKLVEVACLLGFLWGFHQVVRHRMPKWAALGVVAVIGTSLAYVRHTDQLLSELPYMAAVAATLWYLDRLRRTGPLDHATRNQLIILGVLAMAVFNVRREGLAMIAAIGVAQLFDLRGRWRTANWRRLATPFVAFAGSVILLQLVLPSALAPEYENSGLHQTWKKLMGPFRSSFAGQLGFEHLRRTGLLVVFLIVVAGVAVRMWKAAAQDAPLLVFAVGSLVIVGMIPANATRYTMAITPFAVYFAAQAVAAIPFPKALPVKQAGAWLATAVLAAVTLVHLTDLPSTVAAEQRRDDAGYVADGPDQPYAQAAFAAVRTYTHQDDVVAFFKARALTFFTNRRAVQSSDLSILRQRADYFMMRRGSTSSQPLVDDATAAAMGWVAVWQDDDWVLWRLPLYEAG